MCTGKVIDQIPPSAESSWRLSGGHLVPHPPWCVLLLGLASCATTLGAGSGGDAPTVSGDFREMDALLSGGITEMEVGVRRLQTNLMRPYQEELIRRVIPALRRLAEQGRD